MLLTSVFFTELNFVGEEKEMRCFVFISEIMKPRRIFNAMKICLFHQTAAYGARYFISRWAKRDNIGQD